MFHMLGNKYLYVLFMVIKSIDSYFSERTIFGVKSSHVDQLHSQDFLLKKCAVLNAIVCLNLQKADWLISLED